MRQIAVLDHLLDIVGDIGPEITAAQGELAHRHLRVPNIEQHHCLDVVDVVNAEPLQLQLDDLQELTMKALDQRNHFEVEVVHCKPLVRPSFPRRGLGAVSSAKGVALSTFHAGATPASVKKTSFARIALRPSPSEPENRERSFSLCVARRRLSAPATALAQLPYNS